MDGYVGKYMDRKLIINLFIGCLFLCCNSNKTQQENHLVKAHELYNTALQYNLKNQHAIALTYYDSAITLLSTEAKFYTNRGLTKFELKDTFNAIADYRKAIEIDTASHLAYKNLGAVLMDLGNYYESLFYLEESARLSPEQGYIFYNIGLAKYKMNDYQGAKEAFEKHLESKHNLSLDFTYYYLGNCYKGMQNNQKANECWRKADEIAGYNFKHQADSILR